MKSIRNYLAERQGTQRQKHRSTQEQEKLTRQKEKTAYNQATEEARIQKAKDTAYKQQGYKQNKEGKLIPTKRGTNTKKQTPTNRATNYTNNYQKHLQQNGPFGSFQQQTQPHQTPFTPQNKTTTNKHNKKKCHK